MITNSDYLDVGDTQLDEWYIDSGASSHMCHNINAFVKYCKYEVPTKICLGDGGIIFALGQGKVRLTLLDENGIKRFVVLQTVLFVPHLSKNLISVRAMAKSGAEICFDHEKCIIVKGETKFVIGRMMANDKLYRVSPFTNVSQFVCLSYVPTLQTSQLWHLRFGHLNMKYIEQLVKKNLVDGMNCDKFINSESNSNDCNGCLLGKMVRTSCPKVSDTRASDILELIHSDVCGPMQTDSIGGSRYMVTFIDDATRYCMVYFLKKKSEVIDKFKKYVDFVENHIGCKIKRINLRNRVKTIRTDNGREFLSKEFVSFCDVKGILHQLTNPYTPEQNGVAERCNRTIMESVRSMIFHAKVPLCFWAEAASTAVYVHNRSPSISVNGITPYECWFSRKPDVSNLRVFGCVAYYHIPSDGRKKLDPRSCKCMFVGYPDGTKGYKLYDPISKKIYS